MYDVMCRGVRSAVRWRAAHSLIRHDRQNHTLPGEDPPCALPGAVPVAARHASGDGPWFDLSQLTDECIGLNYVDHAADTGATPPAEPVLFMKAPDTVVGPQDGVLIPRRSVKTDYEVELAVVLGATARYLESPQQARAMSPGTRSATT